MRKFGLIGFPLSHSFSKKFFSEKFANEGISGCEYDLYPIEHIGKLSTIISDIEFLKGLNVTIPYKLDVMPYLNEIDEAALAIGAVNCIDISSKNEGVFLKGYNTDAYGFEMSLTPLLNMDHKKALIFGDGGAAKAVKYVLDKLGIPFLVVSRKVSETSISYEDITEVLLDEYTILINTTPLGMSPNYDSAPDIPYDILTERHLAYDLVYNPEETMFLTKAKAKGAQIKNGLEMLYLQAERSWEIWNQ
ncbi:MAG: shikimate dehydrogenase [Pedobacter sp.]|nr:MAG: shikimate dehydrogenase [Pedobacter sp.]